jgi:hypothetical protein
MEKKEELKDINMRKRKVKSELAFTWKDNTITYVNATGVIVTKQANEVLITSNK